MSTATADQRVDGWTRDPVKTIQDLTARLAELSKAAIVLSPIDAVDRIAPMHAITFRIIRVNPETDQKGNGPECWRSDKFCKGDHVVLGRRVLDRIMAAGNIRHLETRRIDDRSDPMYLEIGALLAAQDFSDASWRMRWGHRQLDYRNGSAQIASLDVKDIAQKRRSMFQLGETFAIERCLRLIYALPQTFSAADLKEKPIIIPALSFAPDLSDPDVKQIYLSGVMASAGHASRLLYGPGKPEPLALNGGAPAPLALPSGDMVNTRTGEVIREADPDLPPPEAPQVEPPIYVCGCPCGDQKAVPEAIAKARMAADKCVRCDDCRPGLTFVDARHVDLKSLEIPGRPDLTPARAISFRLELQKAGRK